LTEEKEDGLWTEIEDGLRDEAVEEMYGFVSGWSRPYSSISMADEVSAMLSRVVVML